MDAERGSIIKILLGENPENGSFALRQLLSDIPGFTVRSVPADGFTDTDFHRGEGVPDLILLDASSSEEDPMRSFLGVYNLFPSVPIILVGDTEDPGSAEKTILEGAQDYLIRKKLDTASISRAIRYALARQRVIRQLRSYSVIDELTGLYNRRGFLTIAKHQLEVAQRTGHSLFLAFVDVDGLKRINDILGHHRGDLAIIETANVMRKSFRKTDILARIGGDEFAALLVCDKNVDPSILVQHFKNALGDHNTYGKRGFKLSASIGMARFEPDSSLTVKDLLQKADELMYEQKKAARKCDMTYQLRFLRSAPLASWVTSVASALETTLPPEAWPIPMPTDKEKIQTLKRCLEVGLLSFVTRRSLCGTDEVCDVACKPAPENHNPDRFEACVILGHAHQYLVDGTLNLKEMAERLSNAILLELPGASSVSQVTQTLLQDALAGHLFVNPNCRHSAVCQHSKLMDLKWELGHGHTEPVRAQGE